jgi:hypothetical protein
VVADWCGVHCERRNLGGVTVRAGWILIAGGVMSAVIFQHADSVVFGALMAIIGGWMLTVKEVAR